MNITELAMLKQMSKGGGGASGGGIIDVAELPTTNIDENALYRVPTAALYYGITGRFKHGTTYVVNQLPTTGEPVSLDGQNINATYYNEGDSTLYGYVPAMIGAALGVPEGWYTIEMLFGALNFNYGGVVSFLDEMGDDDTFYLLLQRQLYFYKDGKWREVATEGKTMALHTRTFTSLDEMIEFCGNKTVYSITGNFAFTYEETTSNGGTTQKTAKSMFVTRSVATRRGFIGTYDFEGNCGYIHCDFTNTPDNDYKVEFLAFYNEDGSIFGTRFDGGYLEMTKDEYEGNARIYRKVMYPIKSVDIENAIVVQYFA